MKKDFEEPVILLMSFATNDIMMFDNETSIVNPFSITEPSI